MHGTHACEVPFDLAPNLLSLRHPTARSMPSIYNSIFRTGVFYVGKVGFFSRIFHHPPMSPISTAPAAHHIPAIQLRVKKSGTPRIHQPTLRCTSTLNKVEKS